MTELPDWASDELTRNWPTLSDDDRRASLRTVTPTYCAELHRR